jgi:NagD protein
MAELTGVDGRGVDRHHLFGRERPLDAVVRPPLDPGGRRPVRRAGYAVTCQAERVTEKATTPDFWMCDMDGVLAHEGQMVPGADRFLDALRSRDRPFLILTNNSIYSARDLSARLGNLGLDVPPASLWTSAEATAAFLKSQRPGGTAFVVGEAGLTTALHDSGYVLTDQHPDYVVLGETRTYSFEAITRAIRLVEGGARFIATNPDPTGPSLEGILPATGSVAALIEKATGISPYFIGKPNPLMMREALNSLGAHSESTVMVGDRMDTDIVAGIEAGLQTILVLSGVTAEDRIERFPYRPGRVVDSVADLVEEISSGGDREAR